jgi:hypothetical protein
MRKLFLISLLALSVLFGACSGGGNSNDRELQDARETIRRSENTIADSETPQAEAPTNDPPTNVQEVPPDEPPPAAGFPNLNLPLIAQDVTFYCTFIIDGSLRITADGELQREANRAWNTVAADVRSLESDSMTTFYITNDNNLWGFGSNQNGILGDGTGVDRDEPVFIMENVATVYINNTFPASVVYAIKTDRTFWTWGNGNFAPVHIADDVVRGFGNLIDGSTYYQTTDGNIYAFRRRQNERELLIPEPAFDFTTEFLDFFDRGNIVHFINSERTLVRRTEQREGATYEEIAMGIERLLPIAEYVSPMDNSNLFFTTLDGNLWGIGTNRNGDLGDGTRVPREEPVQIAENIAFAGRNFFIKRDGTFWIWNQNDPVPRQVLENVAALVSHGILQGNSHIHFQDGRFIRHFGVELAQTEIHGIRVPQTHTW